MFGHYYHRSLALFVCAVALAFQISAQSLGDEWGMEDAQKAWSDAVASVNALRLTIRLSEQANAPLEDVSRVSGQASVRDGFEVFAFKGDKRYLRQSFLVNSSERATSYISPKLSKGEIEQILEKPESRLLLPDGRFRTDIIQIFDGSNVAVTSPPREKGSMMGTLVPKAILPQKGGSSIQCSLLSYIGWYIPDPLSPGEIESVKKANAMPDLLTAYEFSPAAAIDGQLLVVVQRELETPKGTYLDKLALDPNFGFMLRERTISDKSNSKVISSIRCIGSQQLTDHAWLPEAVILETYDHVKEAIGDDPPLLVARFEIVETSVNNIEDDFFTIEFEPGQTIADYSDVASITEEPKLREVSRQGTDFEALPYEKRWIYMLVVVTVLIFTIVIGVTLWRRKLAR